MRQSAGSSGEDTAATRFLLRLLCLSCQKSFASISFQAGIHGIDGRWSELVASICWPAVRGKEAVEFVPRLRGIILGRVGNGAGSGVTAVVIFVFWTHLRRAGIRPLFVACFSRRFPQYR